MQRKRSIARGKGRHAVSGLPCMAGRWEISGRTLRDRLGRVHAGAAGRYILRPPISLLLLFYFAFGERLRTLKLITLYMFLNCYC
jgi:hypothetical protein